MLNQTQRSPSVGTVKLMRLATIRLTRPPPTAMGKWTYRATNGVDVITELITGIERDITDDPVAGPTTRGRFDWPREHDKVRVAAYAIVDAGSPQLVADRLEVPSGPRRSADLAIAEYADVLAVVHQCKRTIRSPQPSVALAPSDAAEHKMLAGVTGLRNPAGREPKGARVMPPAIPGQVIQTLTDRLDGLAMLADSLSEDTAIGRVRELFRLFERAFRESPSGCVDPLTSFLSTAPRHDASQYTSEEIRHWFLQLRPAAIHADRHDHFARSADISPFLSRIEFAAYDVLLNMATWGDVSSPRRTKQHSFMSAPRPGSLAPVVLQRGASLTVDWLDPFGVHPVDWEATLSIPDSWHWRMPGQEVQQ
jgi:hypothetical protein